MEPEATDALGSKQRNFTSLIGIADPKREISHPLDGGSVHYLKTQKPFEVADMSLCEAFDTYRLKCLTFLPRTMISPALNGSKDVLPQRLSRPA
jgi:hypothetical protein